MLVEPIRAETPYEIDRSVRALLPARRHARLARLRTTDPVHTSTGAGEEALAAYRTRTERPAGPERGPERPCLRPAAVREPAEARGLSPREIQVLQLVADGLRSKEIAKRLTIAEETVRTHVTNILARLGARNRAHAVALGYRCSLLGPRDEPAGAPPETTRLEARSPHARRRVDTVSAAPA